MNACRHAALFLVVISFVIVVGCGVEPDLPEGRPTDKQLKGWSHKAVTRLEDAIDKKSFKLPALTQDLVLYLRSLQRKLTLAPGATYETEDDAMLAIDGIIEKIQGWYHKALARRGEGDSDADRDELQEILDEAKEVLGQVKTGT